MTRRLRSLTLLAAVLTLLQSGCNSEPKLVKVSGIVLIDGQPLTHGAIQFVPTGMRAAVGEIGKDGRFTLTTTKQGDGCYVGTHAIIVVGNETLGTFGQKWHAPKKYISTESSGLTVTIDGPTDNLKIELTWAGGKPFIERFDGEGSDPLTQ